MLGSCVVNYIQILYLCILKQRKRAQKTLYKSCELHSNLVSLHSETTRLQSTSICMGLWITFKSCIFAFWNNFAIETLCNWIVVNYIQILYLCILKQPLVILPLPANVVNYIQILYLCILKQQTELDTQLKESCELHSNLVSLHSETTLSFLCLHRAQLWITFKSCIFAFWNNWHNRKWSQTLLWITFKSCIFAFWNNIGSSGDYAQIVVNYIQILYLCILKQRTHFTAWVTISCELHSNLVSLHSETTLQ